MVSQPKPASYRREDSIIRFHGVSWDDYQRLFVMRGDRPVPRMAYLEGHVEIMSPSRGHEHMKGLIGRLVTAYCLDAGIDFEVAGSWTLQNKAERVGAEPDDCYVFGTEPTDSPDLAIEVVWTSGRLDKLELYRKLDVQEVWYWRAGELKAYVLRGEEYAESPHSEVLPGLDLKLLASFLDRRTTSQAIREFRAALAG